MEKGGICTVRIGTDLERRHLNCLDLALDDCISLAGCGRGEANEELLDDVQYKNKI